jgi:hypothetical protein
MSGLKMPAITSDERQIAALREDIRRAGKEARLLRWRIASAVLGAFFAYSLYGLAMVSPWLGDGRAAARLFLAGAVAVVAITGCVAAGAVALPAAAALRCWRRGRIGRSLAAMASPDRAALLLRQLERDPLGDTRKIAASLARSIPAPGELSPAAAPTTRGDEASPAEGAP